MERAETTKLFTNITGKNFTREEIMQEKEKRLMDLLEPYESLLLAASPQRDIFCLISTKSATTKNMLSVDDVEKIEKGIKELSPLKEEVIRTLFGIKGKCLKWRSAEDTARLFGKNINTIYKAKSRALEELRTKELEEIAIRCLTFDGLQKEIERLKKENAFYREALARISLNKPEK